MEIVTINQQRGLWRLVVNGRTMVKDESFAVVSAVRLQLENPELWSEAREVADSIRAEIENGKD